MGQVTIYIDPETEKRMNHMIKNTGIPKSKWIADLIRQKIALEWPESVIDMAGSWKDFPSTEEIREGLGHDVEREPA